MRLRVLVVVALLATSVPAHAQETFSCAAESVPDGAPSWMDRMPQPVDTTITMFDVQIPSADGTLLSARVYLPDAFIGPRPTVLWFTPYTYYYGEHEALGLAPSEYPSCVSRQMFFLRRGYAFVAADLRGTHNSGGCIDRGGHNDAADGYALVNWIAAQTWSDTMIGMRGYSWEAISQYATASAAPPALKAIIPVSATLMYDAFHPVATLYEYAPVFAPAQLQPSTFVATNVASPDWANHVARDACAAEHSMQFSELDGTLDAYWAERYFPFHAHEMRAAVLATGSLSGDHAATGDHDHVAPMWTALERADVPRKAYLGPWVHGYPTLPGWSFIELRFLEHHLRGNDTGIMDEPALTLIDQRGDARATGTFPAPNGLVLHAGGGRLAETVPSGSAVYREIPGMQRTIRRSIEATRLLYATDAFDAPLRISGGPRFEVVASIDTTDANFAGYLFDVATDGSRRLITRGWLDARHRHALDQPGEDVVPNVVERYTIELQATEWTLDVGHRLEVMLSGGDSCLTPSEECPWGYIDGVVPDATAPMVTILEGDGLTRLSVPVS